MLFRTIYLAAFAFLLPALFCGCRTYALVDGREIEILSRQEEAEMLEYARAAGLKNAKTLKLTPEQTHFLRTQKPQVRISYVDDRIGRVFYDWVFSPELTLRITLGGYLMTEKMIVRVQLFEGSAGAEKNSTAKVLMPRMEGEEI